MDMWRCFACGQLNADLRMECLQCGRNPADCQRGTVKMPGDVEKAPERKLPKKVPGCNCGYCNPPKQPEESVERVPEGVEVCSCENSMCDSVAYHGKRCESRGPEPKVKTEDLLHPCSSYLPGDDGEPVEQDPELDSHIRLFLKDADRSKDDLSLNPKTQGSTGKEEFNIRLCPHCGAMSDKAHRDVCGKGMCLDCDGIGCSRCIDMSGTSVSNPTLWFNVTRDGSLYELTIGDEVYLYKTLWEAVCKIHDKLMLM